MLNPARVVAALIACLCAVPAMAADYGQWEHNDPEIRAWFQGLMQPDMPLVPCCGEADSYWADAYEVSAKGEYIAIVTDERPDKPLGRAHVDIGTRVLIPNGKIKWDRSNPTGHGVLFLSIGGHNVYCYVPGGGV